MKKILISHEKEQILNHLLQLSFQEAAEESINHLKTRLLRAFSFS